MTKRCPHCKQPMPEPKKRTRTCYDCKRPIRLHDKWLWAERGEGIMTSVHRCCENPLGYGPADAEAQPSTPLFGGAAP